MHPERFLLQVHMPVFVEHTIFSIFVAKNFQGQQIYVKASKKIICSETTSTETRNNAGRQATRHHHHH